MKNWISRKSSHLVASSRAAGSGDFVDASEVSALGVSTSDEKSTSKFHLD